MPDPSQTIGTTREATTVSPSEAVSKRLVSYPWRLVAVDRQHGLVEIAYTFGGCQSEPLGVEVRNLPTSVRITLVALPPSRNINCAPDLNFSQRLLHIANLSNKQIET